MDTKNYSKTILLWMFLLVTSFALTAEERGFTYTYKYQTVKYQVLSEELKTCMTCPGIYTYYSTTSGYTITPGNKINGNLTIPAKVSDGYNEYTVVAIGEGSFYDNSLLNKVELPSTVKRIENDAFNFCRNMLTIMLPDSLESIGRYAFGSCWSLEYLNLPFSVTSIGGGAFAACSSLTQFIIPNKVKIIPDNTFDGCRKLEKIIIPNSVMYIGEFAFYNCSHLESVYLPQGIGIIEAYSFGSCQRLQTVYYEREDMMIESNAFYRSTKVKKIKVNSDCEIEPSGITLKVGDSFEIDVTTSVKPHWTTPSIDSFTMSSENPETEIVEISELLTTVSGISPGYAVLTFDIFDEDFNFKNRGYCFVTVVGSHEDGNTDKVEDVRCDSVSDTEEIYYDLNGCIVNRANIKNGILIRKHAGKTEKIYVK